MKNIFFLTLCICLPLLLSAQNLTETQKIRHLLDHIKNLDGAVFIRNGEEHEAKEAAEHLEWKWGRAGWRVRTAQDFIDKVATKSFLSGELYYVRLANGTRISSKDLLYNELRKLK